jgi:hypothetical protein
MQYTLSQYAVLPTRYGSITNVLATRYGSITNVLPAGVTASDRLKNVMATIPDVARLRRVAIAAALLRNRRGNTSDTMTHLRGEEAMRGGEERRRGEEAMRGGDERGA